MVNVELNKRLIEGDSHAFETVFKLTHPRLLGYCSLFVSDHMAAEDLVQECYVKLWEKRKTIKPRQSVESLLFVMLRNRCLNYMRDRKVSYVEEDIDTVKETDIQHLFEIDFLDMEKKALEEELIEAIKLEIEKLPEKRKLVFIKSKVDGLKNNEIANYLGISVKAVEKHLHQAKVQIQRGLMSRHPVIAILVTLLLK
jgi:RNA polymerase sigma-70 factor (ECF subfamily)